DLLPLERDLFKGAVLDIRKERGIRNRRDARIRRPKGLEHRQQHDRDDYPQDDVLRQIVQSVTSQDGERAYAAPSLDRTTSHSFWPACISRDFQAAKPSV